MRRTPNYQWLEQFWTQVIVTHPLRRWRVMSLYDGDILLRDGMAHGLIRERLHSRKDIEYHCVEAWGEDPAEVVPDNVDYLFLGRLQPYTSSRYATVAQAFEKATYGKFLDPYSRKQLGHTVTYGERYFSRRAMGEQFQAAPYRRCDIDYGLFLFWNQDDQSRVAISGLGSFGTLCLSVILTHDVLRRRLAQQARDLLPDDLAHLPQQQIELCVRCQVEDEKELANLLPSLCALQPNDDRCPFDFRVEAIAVKTTGGKQIEVEEPEPLELLLRAARKEEQGGEVRTATTEWKALPRFRFKLLLSLVEGPRTSHIDELCRLVFGSFPTLTDTEAVKRQSVRLAKLVHDLNENLKKDVLLGAREKPLIRYVRKDKGYAFAGVKARVV